MLSLSTRNYVDHPGAGLVAAGSFVNSLVVPESGRFDFGGLLPNEYALTVDRPGAAAFEVRFAIDPSAPNEDVLIDASPAYYCSCCGWDFEPR
jgi:hypothetical protein